jgi:hypothetical protein
LNKPKLKIESVFRCSGNRNGSDFQKFSSLGGFEKYCGKFTRNSSIPAGRVQMVRSQRSVETEVNSLNVTSYSINFYVGMSCTMSVECLVPDYCARRPARKTEERYLHLVSGGPVIAGKNILPPPFDLLYYFYNAFHKAPFWSLIIFLLL